MFFFDLCRPIPENVNIKCEQSFAGRDLIRELRHSCEQNFKAHSHGVTKTATAID